VKFILIDSNPKLIDAGGKFFSNEQNVTSLGVDNKALKIDAIVSPAIPFTFLPHRWLALFLVFLISSCQIDGQGKLRNTDTAYVKQAANSDSLMIRVFLKTAYMVHDPVSLLKPTKYYMDSMLFLVPNSANRVTSFEKIRTIPAMGYPFVQGSIAFIADSIRIYLLYNDYDHKKIDTCVWNKDYVVKWQ
jgi:hypothetical protein